MGTVADKLNRLRQTKSDIRAALVGAGQSVTDATPFAEYADRIRSITPGVFGNENPIGTVISYMGQFAPNGYLICDGTEYNISQYSQLAEFFESQFGSSNYFGGNGTTTFAVPDMRNLFLRGYRGDSTEVASGLIGVRQSPTLIPYYFSSGGSEEGLITVMHNNEKILLASYGDSLKDTAAYATHRTRISGTILESAYNAEKEYLAPRPVNMAVLYCIKATSPGAVSQYLEEYDTENGWHVRKWSNGYCELIYTAPVEFAEWVPWDAPLWQAKKADGTYGIGSVHLPIAITERLYENGQFYMPGDVSMVYATGPSDSSLLRTCNYNVIRPGRAGSLSGYVSIFIAAKWSETNASALNNADTSLKIDETDLMSEVDKTDAESVLDTSGAIDAPLEEMQIEEMDYNV